MFRKTKFLLSSSLGLCLISTITSDKKRHPPGDTGWGCWVQLLTKWIGHWLATQSAFVSQRPWEQLELPTHSQLLLHQSSSQGCARELSSTKTVLPPRQWQCWQNPECVELRNGCHNGVAQRRKAETQRTPRVLCSNKGSLANKCKLRDKIQQEVVITRTEMWFLCVCCWRALGLGL